MGRGVSSGGGQSSLGYLFGSDETRKPAANQTPAADNTLHSQKPSIASPPVDAGKQIPAGIQQKTANNYHHVDGRNSGNFLTDRPSTNVRSAPGGGSSLSYLFGGGGNR